MNTLEAAKTALTQGDFTCAVAHEGKVIFTSQSRGVAPVVEYYHQNGDAYRGAVLADRVVGRAVALLAQLCGFRRVYAATVSRAAIAELERAGIALEYGQVTGAIHDRQGEGPCPMEKLAQGVDDPRQLLDRIEHFLAGRPGSSTAE